MNEINSKDYWNGRFETGDWKKNGGGEQTKYFAELFQKNIPDWLKNYIKDRKLSVLDLGCAQGEGTKVLSQMWENQVSGADFSECAVKKAQEQYPDIHFEVQDVLNLEGTWDVVFMSNVLEHFRKPYDVLSRVQEHAQHMVIVLVPFEEPVDVVEHFAKFTYDIIPLVINGFVCIYHNDILDCDREHAQYFGQQMILVYSKDVELNCRIPLKQSSSILETWTTSCDYIRFKEKYYALDFEYISHIKNSGALEYQLQENQSRIIELEQELNETHDLLSACEQKNIECERQNADLQGKLCVLEDQNADLQRKLREHEKQTADLQRDLFENNHCIAILQNKLSDDEEEKQELQQRLDENLKKYQETVDKYDNLYAYSSSRDAEYIKLQTSKSYRIFSEFIKPLLHYTYVPVKKIIKIFKLILTLNFLELKKELLFPIHRGYLIIKQPFVKNKVLLRIQKELSGKKVVVFPPTIDWHMPLFQRPQQLALSYSRKSDAAVIYISKNSQYDMISVAERPQENLWIINENCISMLPWLLKNAKCKILSISWTINKNYIELVKPDKFIYEYIDELEVFAYYGPEMEADHRKLMQVADITVCTATKLYNQVIGKAKNPILSPNAGDYDFFKNTSKCEVNSRIANAVSRYDCVLGYYGALASWFDYELIKTVALRKPNWLIVLVGINYDGTLDKSGINQIENIIYVPPQPYTELPSYLTAFDVATIPFVINEITLSTSPVKLFEYMAGGKPILTSKMPECLKYESVRTYADADEFCKTVEEYMAMKPDDPYWDILKREALENTWDARTEQILDALNL